MENKNWEKKIYNTHRNKLPHTPPHRRVGRLTAASHAGPDRRQPPPVYHVTCARCERGGEITQRRDEMGGLLGWENYLESFDWL